ncbi:xaa-Pro aminopeptidase 3 isoform X2 [Lampetra fluviatilis]
MALAFPCRAALSARRANDAVRNLRAWLPQTRWFCRSVTSGQPEGASSPQLTGRYLGQPAPHTHPHLLQPGGATAATHKAVLLVPPRDATRELWDGPRSGPDGAVALTGVDEAFPLQELARVLAHAGEPPAWWYYPHGDPPHPEMHERHVGPMLAPAAAQGRVHSLRKHVAALRLVKSQAEVRVMRAAAEITAQAMVETMRASSPPVDEAFLYAKFEFECRALGAEILAYPPVVAGGNRANILHYVKNNQIIQDGEMVLLDGGCELHGYASDVTRTWPVSGCFSGPQAELYEAVLDVQKLCLRGCRAGSTMEGLYSLMLLQLGQRLQGLGILDGGLSPGAAAKASARRSSRRGFTVLIWQAAPVTAADGVLTIYDSTPSSSPHSSRRESSRRWVQSPTLPGGYRGGLSPVACVCVHEKGGRTDCNNYRGISLLSVPGKVLARIIQPRLARHAEERLAEPQCGFRKGRSCTNAIFSVRLLQQRCREFQQDLHLCFIDLVKA